ncbi:zinc-dependent alcohol dehydrogenase family protein [uncultured Gimesia sp.]|uniref:zinc-dependent alcohol dehydrogenase family protein n=1 Tax=uncultured Gimesia sp. TaxID=1678688 RepID=UPI0030DB8395|tara:strand:- start:105462 stop:106466 length:1005 start_codon:yes stop_codon:yes gene_type:complete
MKAMVLNQRADISGSPLVLADVPAPNPGPNEVLIRVHCCAICRTDLHVIEGDLPETKSHIIPGHQVVGTVIKMGASCKRFQNGDRVGIAWLRSTCGVCEFCQSGRENLCEQSRFTGYHADGGYAELAVVQEDYAYAIPDVFSDLEATPLLCAGIIGYRALKQSDLQPGERLGIYGFGSSAHVVIQMALHHGCDVFVVTRGEKHRKLAREMGAVWVGARSDQMPVKVHSAIIFAPAGELVPAALKHLEKGGTLALAGIYMSDIPQLNYEETLFYERSLRSVTANTRQDGQELLKEAAEIPICPHITTYSLQDANRALIDLKNDQINGTGVLVMES